MMFLNNINLDQNELLNGVIHKSTSTTRPSTPVVGQLTYDTEEFTLYSWNGTAWVSISDQDAVLSIIGTSPINAYENANRQVTISIDSATGGATPALGAIALGGDLNGTGTTALVPVVSGVGYGTADAETASSIHTAVGKSHDQNTDTGTTNTTFQIDSDASGPKLKNVSSSLELRNAADDAYANLRVNDLHVNGTLTYVHSTDVYMGDSIITLNAQVMQNTSNSNGGVDIKRLLADESGGTDTITGVGVVITGSGTTFLTDVSVGDVLIFGTQRRTITKIISDTSLEVDEAFNPQPSGDNFSWANQANARIYFDNSTGSWKVIDGSTTDLQTFQLARKYAANIGNGTDKDIIVTHNLNTRDVTVSVLLNSGTYEVVMVDWDATTVDTITLHFKKIPTTSQYRVVITG